MRRRRRRRRRRAQSGVRVACTAGVLGSAWMQRGMGRANTDDRASSGPATGPNQKVDGARQVGGELHMETGLPKSTQRRELSDGRDGRAWGSVGAR